MVATDELAAVGVVASLSWLDLTEVPAEAALEALTLVPFRVSTLLLAATSWSDETAI